MKTNSLGYISNLKNDIPASIVVFLVAMPLCLGIALASGAPLFSGIIAGIVGGIIVSVFSGSQIGVSGPAAGLAVIVLTAINDLGAFEIFLVAVIIAGIIQIILGIAKAGIIGYYFPSSVIKGMLSGIGIIIVLKQIPHALGYKGDGLEGFTFSNIANLFNYITPGAVIIVSVAMTILILWEQPFMKKIGLFKIIQGPLVAVVSGIVLAATMGKSGALAIHPDQLVSIPVAGSIGDFFNQFTFPDFSKITSPEVLIVGVTIAIVASLETLLCVEATDKLDPYKRITPTNKELIAQGVGNIVSGFIGGLPITQVIVRSSANVQSGGKTKVSAFVHGILLLISALAIPKVINMIPLASLAAILFIVGYKLAKPAIFKQVFKSGYTQFVPFIVTIIGIVFTDLLLGIGMGMVVAVMQILWNNYRTPYHFDPSHVDPEKPIFIELSEDVSFLNKAGILHTLNIIPADSHVIIDATKTKKVHPDIIEIIDNFRDNAQTRDITIELKGFTENGNNNAVTAFSRALGALKENEIKEKRPVAS